MVPARPIRVLHCPTSVGGQPQGLARAERELGLASRAVIFEPGPFAYETDEILYARAASPTRRAIWRELNRWRLLWRALRQFDIIHFNFGETTMPQGGHGIPWPESPFGRWLHTAYGWYARMLEMRDLPLLRRADKGIVVTFQGDDARQGDFCQEHFEIGPTGEVEPGYYDPAVDAHKRERIVRWDGYADFIYSVNPDLLHVLPARARFLPYGSVDPRQWRMPEGFAPNRVPVVVHAPSHRGVKGTRFIQEALARLKQEGVAFDFRFVEGMTNAEARRAYEGADLLVDQLLLGWYGGVAVECMALGKPVACYIREGDLKFLPDAMRRQLPIIRAEPRTIYAVLKEWLTVRRADLPAAGAQSRRYVEDWHDPLRIAAGLKADYETIMAQPRKRRGQRGQRG